MNLTKRIISACNNEQQDKLNILLMHSNERYESFLAKTGHTFYCPMLQDTLWEKGIEKRPENIYLLGKEATNYQFLTALNFDLAIGQNRNNDWAVINNISNILQIPTILIERHPPPSSKEYNEKVEAIKNISADINVFDNYTCQKMWGFMNAITIEDPVPRDYFYNKDEKRDSDLMTVVHNKDNDPRANAIWDFMVSEFPDIKPIGKFRDFSNHCNTVHELTDEYNKTKIYVNMNVTTCSSLKEAMLCGCAVVSMSDELNDVIEDGVNGYLCMDLSEMKQKTQILLDNPDMAREMGKKAAESLEEKYTVEQFTKSWNEIFNTIKKGIKQ